MKLSGILVRIVPFAAALSVTAVAAGATTFFGPKQYTMSTTPQTFSENVPLEASQQCNGKAAFTLVIQNGNQLGAIDSASVALNGTALLRESDFKPANATLEIPIELRSTNRLDLTLKGGRPGSSVTLSIRKEIDDVVGAPKTYVLVEKQQVFSESVAIADPLSPFVILIQAGDAAGAHRPKAFSVSVNGSEAATEKDFVGAADTIRKSIAPQSMNVVTADVRGTPGDILKVSIKRILDENACGPKVFIDSPAESGVVRELRLLVTGHATSASKDLGITVAGRVAQIDSWHAGTAADPFRWIAVLDGAPAGALTLTAIAMDGRGTRGTASRTITYSPQPEQFSISADVDYGLAPFVARFHVKSSSSAPAVSSYAIDFDGDGAYEFTGATLPEPVTFSYGTAGIKRVDLRIFDVKGALHTSSAFVTVQNPAAIDSIIRARWQQLREALAAQDVEAAVHLFDASATEKYRRIYTELFDRLPSITAGMNLRGAVSIHADYADYLVTRNEDGVTRGYHLTMVRDASGIWKVADF